MHIPVQIEVGCFVYVVIPVKFKNNIINTLEKWCQVIEIHYDSIKDDMYKTDSVGFLIPSFVISQFTFGSIDIPNPEFDFNRLTKIK